MSTRERMQEHENDPQDQRERFSEERSPDGALDNLQEAGQILLDRGDHAIQRALSGNSLAFLNSQKQQGGQ